MRDLPGTSSGDSPPHEAADKKAKHREQAYPFVRLQGKLLVPGLLYASVLSALEGESWLWRGTKLGAGPVHQICSVSELRNQRCQWVGLGLEPQQSSQTILLSVHQSSWTPQVAAKTRLTVSVEPRKALRLKQREPPVEVHRKGRPGSRASCGLIRKRWGHRGLVFTSSWGPG